NNTNQWKKVTTCKRPTLATDQAGRPEHIPLSDGRPGDTNRADSVKAWEARRKQFASAIRLVLGAPTNLSPPPLEVRELVVEELESYTRRHVLIQSEPDDWIPAYLLVPKPLRETRRPAMICLH